MRASIWVRTPWNRIVRVAVKLAAAYPDCVRRPEIERSGGCRRAGKQRFCRFSGLCGMSGRCLMKAAAGSPARESFRPPCTTRANKESSDMKRAIFSVLAVVVLAGLTGCITQRGPRPTACMGGSCAERPRTAAPAAMIRATTAPIRASSPDRWPVCLGVAVAIAARVPLRPCRGRGGSCRGRTGDRQITYPYYTNRGPRDFLAKNPPSIGP